MGLGGHEGPGAYRLQAQRERICELVSPQRNGYMYWLTREKSGEIGYVHAEWYVYQDVFTSLDPETGWPTYHEDKIPRTRTAERRGIWPSNLGAGRYRRC